MIFSTTHTPWWILVASALFLLPRRALIIVIPVITLTGLFLEALGASVWGNPGYSGQWVVLAAICLLEGTPRGLKGFGTPRVLVPLLLIPTLLLGDESSSLAILVATSLAYRSYLPLLLSLPVTLMAAASTSGGKRMWLYEQALQMIAENPWGLNPGYFRAYQMGQVSPGVDYHMESAVLTAIASIGWIPLAILFISMVVVCLCIRVRPPFPSWLYVFVPVMLFERLYLPVWMVIGCFVLCRVRMKWLVLPMLVYVVVLVIPIVAGVSAQTSRLCGLPLTRDHCLLSHDYHTVLRLDPLNRTALARIAYFEQDSTAARIHDSLTRKRWVTTTEPLYTSPPELIAAYREWVRGRR